MVRVNLAQGGIVLFFAEEREDGDERAGAHAGDDVEFGTAAGSVAPAVEDAATKGAVSISAGKNGEYFSVSVLEKAERKVGLVFLIATGVRTVAPELSDRPRERRLMVWWGVQQPASKKIMKDQDKQRFTASCPTHHFALIWPTHSLNKIMSGNGQS